MPVFVNPLDERGSTSRSRAPRLDGLQNKTLALFDISKPGGSVFLDRLERLLVQGHGVAKVVRVMKPTYTKPAPDPVLEGLRFVDGVIEALAD
jgi:hypothetical protein